MRIVSSTIFLCLLVACTGANDIWGDNIQRVGHLLGDFDAKLGKVPEPQKGIPRYVPSELPSGHNLL